MIFMLSDCQMFFLLLLSSLIVFNNEVSLCIKKWTLTKSNKYFCKVLKNPVMIKIQEQSLGTSANGDVIKFLTNFHDEESEPEPEPEVQPTSQELLQYVDRMIDIRVTPIKEIQQFIQQNYCLEESELKLLTSRILRKKRILKRLKAKNRTREGQIIKLEPNYYPSPTNSVLVDLTFDQTQKKKKRNRISAQISRDRKKQYLVELEEENKRLSEQTGHFKRQNEELKRTINELHTKKSSDQQIKGDLTQIYEPKNRFIKLLVFLGIIFLFTTLKDLMKGDNVSLGFSKHSDPVSISSEEQSSLIGKVESLFGDFSNEFNQIGGGFKSQISKKIAGLKRKTSPMFLPSEVYQGIIYSTESISN